MDRKCWFDADEARPYDDDFENATRSSCALRHSADFPIYVRVEEDGGHPKGHSKFSYFFRRLSISVGDARSVSNDV